MSKIADVEVVPVLIGRSASEAAPILPKVPVVAVRVRTDDGLEGIGHTLGLNGDGSLFRALTTAVEELGSLVLGEDPMQPERTLARMLFPAFPPQWFGPGGLLNIAAAAIDIAVWDAVGKATGQPLWRLLGGASERVDVYDSGSLLSQDIDELQTAAAKSRAAGYNAMKMRGGPESQGIEGLVARVRAVREVIGPDIRLMYDVNQRWTPTFAVRAGRRLEEFDLFWMEEPNSLLDVAGLAALARTLDLPICAGESYYDLSSLRRLLEAEAVDVLMFDVLRLGGITQARKVAPMAEAFSRPVCPHLLMEIDAHLIAAAPNGLTVEHVGWYDGLYEGMPTLLNGELVLSGRPGHGLTFDEDLLRARRAE